MSHLIINKEEEKSNIYNFKSFIKQLKEIDLNEINKEKIEFIKLTLSQIFKYSLKIDIKNYKHFFEKFQKVLEIIVKLFNINNNDVRLCILEELYFLLSNIKTQDFANYLYSTKFYINSFGMRMNILDIFISIGCKDYSRKEEFLNTQVNLMKSIVLKLDEKTVNYFYDSDINQFGILEKSLFLYDYNEYMVRAAVKNILLLITKIKNTQLTCYLTSFPVALYYPIIIYKLKDSISQLDQLDLNNKANIDEYLEEKHSELFDTILYINDILLCNITNINFVLINCLTNEIIFPLFNIILSKKKEKISLTNTIYILSLFIFYIKNAFVIDLICFFLFREKIPVNLFEIIKKYNYVDNNKYFMSDINSLIKNISEADINDLKWKRNADFIKKNIGLDLYTGVIEKDNNYHFFRNYFIEKNKKEKEIKNGIFQTIKELFTTKDDSIIINISLLLYNTIYYYYNYFKKYKKNDELENNDIIGLNKIRHTEISTNNLKDLNMNYNNALLNKNNKTLLITKKEFNIFNKEAAFNPFLSPFFNIIENKINEEPTLFTLLLKLLKNEKIYRISTNELILNIIKFLLQIYLPRKNYSLTEILLLKNKINMALKEEISKLKLLMQNIPNLCYYYAMESHSYYKSEIFDNKLKDLMKLYYILVPFNYLEQCDKIPLSLKEDKKSEDVFRNHMINIYLLLDIISLFEEKNKKNNKNNINNNPIEIEKDTKYFIGKTYKKEELGKEYAFCYIGNKLEDFQTNLDNIKKCVFIITKYNFYLGEIESKTFKDLSKIKILYNIPLRFLNIQYPISENDCFVGINNISNNPESVNIIMNCFDSENTKKVFNYLLQMISNCIIFEKTLFETFLESIESQL